MSQVVFSLGDVVEWTLPRSAFAKMARDTFGPSVRGRVYQLSPLCIETAAGTRFDTSSYPAGVAPVQQQVTVKIAGATATITADPTLKRDEVRFVMPHQRSGKTAALLAGWTQHKFHVGYDPGSSSGDVTIVEEWRLPPVDPLDVEYDGNTLRELLVCDEIRRRDLVTGAFQPTPLQRSAISAHWSAQLRAKVETSKQKEREQVVSDYDEDRP